MSPRFPVRVLVLSLAALATMSAHAVPVTYTFSGGVDFVGWGGSATPTPFQDGFPFGHTGSGSFTFDPELTTPAGFGFDPGPTDTGVLYRAAAPDFAGFSLFFPTFAPLANFSTSGDCGSSPYSYAGVQNDDPRGAYEPPVPNTLTDRWIFSVVCVEQVSAGVTAQRSLFVEFSNVTDDQTTPGMLTGLDVNQPFDWTLANTRSFAFGYSLQDANCTTCEFGTTVENWSLGLSLESFEKVAVNDPVAVPEPGTTLLFLFGIAAVIVASRSARARAVRHDEGQPGAV